ncbi:ABC transporter substrate-binding protein [Synechococcus sp. W2B2]|uniref:ABC transporter substrate-binding protein n=1 Tax=unclassified Synechococcus TaxID=2626047 RepID=UPI00006ADAF8|nr:ABC transporter substrate-binding protein [Synechococcus sp. WH 7805]EAR17568.1 Extracellular ligand-binding receptor [Synechococcus sp. WH 7805]
MLQQTTITALFLLAGLTKTVHAEEIGVTPRSILLGQSAAFSGPSGELGREYRQGAHLVFDHVNAQGGIHGRQVVMVYRDDQYNPELTLNNTKKFINKDKVFALFGYLGTPTVKASLPLIDQSKIPLIAPLTGAQIIRSPMKKNVFNIRASYHQEIKAIVSYLIRYGRQSIAIAYQNDSFGRDGLEGLKKALAKHQLKPVVETTVERNSSNTSDAARKVALARPDAVLVVSSYGTVSSFISQLRQFGSNAQVLTVSFVGSNALARSLPKELRHGIGISQVVPFPWDRRTPVVRDYQNKISKLKPDIPYSFVGLEGYIAASMLVQALQKAGPDLTRKRFITAVESLGTVDLGGYKVTFGPRQRNGSDIVHLTFLVGRDGSFIN